jgi:hypothetical protein
VATVTVSGALAACTAPGSGLEEEKSASIFGAQDLPSQTLVNFIGYSGDKFSATPGLQMGCKIRGRATTPDQNDLVDCDDAGGASGGPLFLLNGNAATIVGVASVGQTCAPGSPSGCVPTFTTYSDAVANGMSPTSQIANYPMSSTDIGVGLTSTGKVQVYVSDADNGSIKTKTQQMTSGNSFTRTTAISGRRSCRAPSP